MEDLLKTDKLNADNSTRIYLDKINMLLENIFCGRWCSGGDGCGIGELT